MANRDIRSNEDLAKAYGDINQSYRSKGFSPVKGTGGSIAKGQLPSYAKTTSARTPQEWEQQTGNKLLSYSTVGGTNELAMNMPMSYSKNQPSTMSSGPSIPKSDLLVQSAYQQIMDRSGGGSAGMYQGKPESLSKGGFYGSMPQLEVASMRLADAALGRELIIGEQKGEQEKGLQELRGTQDIGLQGLRGSQESGLQTQRLKAEQEASRGTSKAELNKEIRDLEMERIRIGATPRTPSSVDLYNNLGRRISELRREAAKM